MVCEGAGGRSVLGPGVCPGSGSRVLGPLGAWASVSLSSQAAQLEAARPPRLRYLLVVSTRERVSQDETVLLGVDFPDSRLGAGRAREGGKKGRRWGTIAFPLCPASSHHCTLGLVLPLWSDTQVYLDGDG